MAGKGPAAEEDKEGRVFHISLEGLKASQLPRKDLFSKCDSYFVFHWPTEAPQITPVITKSFDPIWEDWKLSFPYTIPGSNNVEIHEYLSNQYFKIECYASHSFREDSLIGSVSLDLLSLLAGPTQHSHTITSRKGQAAGRVEFSLVATCMRQCLVQFKSLSVHLKNNIKSPTKLTFQPGTQHEKSTSLLFKTSPYFYESILPLKILCSLPQLLDCKMRVNVMTCEDTTQCHAISNIPLGKYINLLSSWILFREYLYRTEEEKEQNTPCGILEGRIRFSRIPVPCQMPRGLNTDNLFSDASLLVSGLFGFEEKEIELGAPLHSAYSPNQLIISPYDIPNSLLLEIEVHNLLEDIAADTSSSYQTSLHSLASIIDGDPMVKDLIYREDGISLLLSFGHKRPEFQRKISEILLLAMKDFPKLVAVCCCKENMKMMIHFLCSDDQETFENGLVIFLMIAESSSLGRDYALQEGAVDAIAKRIGENSLAVLRCLEALAFSISSESIETKKFISSYFPLILSVVIPFINEGEEETEVALALLENCSRLYEPLSSSIFFQLLLKVSEASPERFERMIEIMALAATHMKSFTPTEEQKHALVHLLHVTQNAGCKERILQLLISLSTWAPSLFSLVELSTFQSHEDTLYGLNVIVRLSMSDENSLLFEHNFPVVYSLLETEKPNYFIIAEAKLCLVALSIRRLKCKGATELLAIFNDLLTATIISIENQVIILTILQEIFIGRASSIVMGEEWECLVYSLLSLLRLESGSDCEQVVYGAWNFLEILFTFPGIDKVLLEPITQKNIWSSLSITLQLRILSKTLYNFPTSILLQTCAWQIIMSAPELLINDEKWETIFSPKCLELLEQLLLSPPTTFEKIVETMTMYLACCEEDEKCKRFLLQLVDKIWFTSPVKISPYNIPKEIVQKIIHLEQSEGRNKNHLVRFVNNFPNCFNIVAQCIELLKDDKMDMKSGFDISFLVLCNSDPKRLNIQSSDFLVLVDLFLGWFLETSMSISDEKICLKILRRCLSHDEGRKNILAVTQIALSSSSLVIGSHKHFSMIELCCSFVISQDPGEEHAKELLNLFGFGNLFTLLFVPEMESYFNSLYFLLSTVISTLGNQEIENFLHATSKFEPFRDMFAILLSSLDQESDTEKNLSIFSLFTQAWNRVSYAEANAITTTERDVLPLLSDLLLFILSHSKSPEWISNIYSSIWVVIKTNPEYVAFFEKEKAILQYTLPWLELHSDLSSLLQISHVLHVIFFSAIVQKDFVQFRGFNQLACAIFRSLGYLRSSALARSAVLEATNFLVGAAQVPALQPHIIMQGVLPVMIELLCSVEDSEILLVALGFLYFIGKNYDAKVELIDHPKIDYLAKFLDPSPAFSSTVTKAAIECYLGLSGVMERCSTVESGLMSYQEYVGCRTCGILHLCLGCAKICHQGHKLTPSQRIEKVCGCGSSPCCLIKKRPSLRLQYPIRMCSIVFTGRVHEIQAWYYCRSCFRDYTKGICSTCAQVCHEGHELVFGNESKFYCDCNERHGIPCRCNTPPRAIKPGLLPIKRLEGVTNPFQFEETPLVEQKVMEISEERPDTYKEDDTCVICSENSKDALFFPCGHILACIDCAEGKKGQDCTICQTKIKEVIRTFRV